MNPEKIKALILDAKARGSMKAVSVDDFVTIGELALAGILAQREAKVPSPTLPATQDEADETDGLVPVAGRKRKSRE